MGRKRTKELAKGVTERKRKHGPPALRISFTDQHGKRQQELAGTDARAAERLRLQRLREVDAGTFIPRSKSNRKTLAGYAAEVFGLRRQRGLRSVDDEEGWFDRHIAPRKPDPSRPEFGKWSVAEIRPRDVHDLIEGLRREGRLSAKSLHNIHGVLHVILERARFDELIVANPASLPRGMLPKVGKKKQPRFQRDEVVRLLTELPEDRRVFYALQSLGGLRLGEASGRRWSDLDRDAPGLWAMAVRTQYEDQPLKTARDEDAHERVVPVHPVLHDILQRWEERGFRRLHGRPPRPSDWICADPKTGKPRSQNQAIKALYRDCARLGIERRGCHALRRAFISLARSDGSRHDVLEVVTHNAKGEMIDVYTSFEWSAMCTAVSALRIDLGDAKGDTHAG